MPPRGARRVESVEPVCIRRFQFTCPSRSTTEWTGGSSRSFVVSIHVPLAEHDYPFFSTSPRFQSFNSRAPRGARPFAELKAAERTSFNSRTPRGARRIASLIPNEASSFNSRAPRGARRDVHIAVDYAVVVSIHVPLAEHDVITQNSSVPSGSFNSRAPRGARHYDPQVNVQMIVSIHVPLAEHDTSKQ